VSSELEPRTTSDSPGAVDEDLSHTHTHSLRQTVHIHSASVHQTAKLAVRIARATAGLAESNGSLLPGL